MKIFEIKNYTYIKPLSSGGEGTVHLVKKGKGIFVGKVVALLPENMQMIFRQIKKMNIPNCAKIYEFYNFEDKTVIIRQYIQGETLAHEIQKNGNFSFTRCKKIITDICSALNALHQKSPCPIIYRDLKPENIIITPLGDAILIDFGIARYYENNKTKDTVVAGTPGYSAPEIMMGMQSDKRSDIYSLGVICYEMLSGKNLTQVPYQIRPLKENGVLAPSCMDLFIKKATDVNPANRYSNIEEFLENLNNLDKIKKQNIKKSTLAGLICLCALAIILLLVNANKQEFKMILSVDFNSQQDKMWVLGYENQSNNIEFVDDKLCLLNGGCNIDFKPKPGMIVHYSVKMPRYATVGLSQYRINGNMTFECLYYNQLHQKYIGTGDLDLEGLVFKNGNQFVAC